MALEIKRTTEFFAILGHFLPFDPPNNPKNHNFEKMKNKPGDFIILHLRTTNDNHMINGSWDIGHDWLNFLSFWAIFFLMPHEQPEKPKFWKNEKKTNNNHNWRPHHFTLVYNKWRIIWCMAPEIWSVTYIIFSDFGLYLALLLLHPLNGPENQNLINWKKCLEILSFYTLVP